MNITITRPQKEDVDELKNLFTTVISDAFKQDGIESRLEAIQEEVEKELGFLNQDFESHGLEVYFLIARAEEQIVGTVAYSKPSDFMKENLELTLHNTPEVTTVYVLPEFQGQGVGSLLFKAILLSLLHKQVEEICLDGGYRKSQSFWIKKIGEPNVTLKDYWGEGLDHMFWHRKLNDLPIQYRLEP